MVGDGYIHRGTRLLNWDAHLQTSVADDETYSGTIKVGFRTFRYPLKGSVAMLRIPNPEGRVNATGGPYAGLDRYGARKRVTEDMEKLGLFDGREDRDISMKFSDRSKTPIEPYLSDQWFVKMGDLTGGKPGFAQTAMDAVTSKQVRFF